MSIRETASDTRRSARSVTATTSASTPVTAAANAHVAAASSSENRGRAVTPSRLPGGVHIFGLSIARRLASSRIAASDASVRSMSPGCGLRIAQ